MPTPDSSSTEAVAEPGGVFFVHALTADRSFWAWWPSRQAYTAGHAPQAYAVCEDADEQLRPRLQARYGAAAELELSSSVKTGLYRCIRRAELPEYVRLRIEAAIALQRQLQQQRFAEAGFRPQDLAQKSALKRRYRSLARLHHPDRGGDPVRFMQLRELYEKALQTLQGR